MLIIKDKKDCSGCSACYSICPTKAISMKEDKEGFEYPSIDKIKCIKCGLCEKICPCINEKENTNFIQPRVLAAWSLDSKNKYESSSGGCFYELAKFIIQKEGIVIGAGFDEQLNVVHKIAYNHENLIELKGSKYVQSRIGKSFIETKKYLDNDKLVLFVGTSCQVAGLYSFLKNKKYDNLFTVDLVCHGVPSPKVYRKYIKEKEKNFNSKVKSISFRDKTFGWKKFSMKIKFENNKLYLKKLHDDTFMRGFLNNIYLRPSCYDCKFSKLPRIADITLGDFWGISNKDKSLDDDSGISELVINSDKGESLLKNINENIYTKEIDLEYGIKANPCLVGSVKMPHSRQLFFNEIDNMSLGKLSKKYFPKKNLIIKIISKTNIIIKKLVR